MKWRVGVIGAAAVAWLAPIPASATALYGSSLFPRVQAFITSLSNRAPFALLDLLLILSVGGIVVQAIRDLRRHRALRAALRLAVRIVTVAAVAYLAFLFTWGLNYRREPLRQRLQVDRSRVRPESVAALARETVRQMNRLYGPAHNAGWQAPLDTDPALASALTAAVRRLGLSERVVVGRPKHSALLDLYFRRAGVAGMTDPFLLETLVASDLLPFERPSVIAHEWGHLAGVTDEGEANLVAWVTCVASTPPHQYSGWIGLYAEVVDSLPRESARAVMAQLASGPRSDLDAIRQRYAREVNTRLSRAGWNVYDEYLKANRVESGTRSYAEVVQLILGAGLWEATSGTEK